MGHGEPPYPPGAEAASWAHSAAQHAQRSADDLGARVARLEKRLGVDVEMEFRAKVRALIDESMNGSVRTEHGIYAVRVDRLLDLLKDE